jgi:cytochrome c
MRTGAPHLLLPACLALVAVQPAAGQDAGRGEDLYGQRCGACHSLDADRVGPHHRGVFGRRAGGAEGYDYSPALRRARIVWNSATLDAWLANPEALIPGQRMGYSVPDAMDRVDIIAYLRRVSTKGN